MQEQVIARATNGEMFTNAQVKEMIERTAHTIRLVKKGGAVVEGNEARSKTERDAKHGKNDTCDPNHSGDITTATRRVAADLSISDIIEIGRKLTEHGHGSWLSRGWNAGILVDRGDCDPVYQRLRNEQI